LVEGLSPLERLVGPFQKLDEGALRAARDEATFDEATFDLLKQISIRIAILASVQPADEHGSPPPWRRDQAILCGSRDLLPLHGTGSG
jgi:hypothetical protein